MDSNSKRPHESQDAFRQRVKQRVLGNRASALDLHKDFRAAEDAKGAGAEDLISTKPSNHSNRDLLNKILRDKEWPGLYWAQIPMRDKKTGEKCVKWMPFLLPHEWVSQYCKQHGAFSDLLEFDDEELHARLLKLAKQLNAPALVALGLHGDGVPIGGNMSPDSLDVFNLTMITSSRHSGLRVPFVCTQLKHTLHQETFDAIVEVLCWSLQCLAAGEKPTARHDGSPWLPSDKRRAVRPEQGTSLGVQAVLAEIRADWVFLQKLLKFPAWNTLDGLCWRCKCTHKCMRTLDTASASWRFQRLLPGEFLQWCRRQGRPISKLFTLPGVEPEIVFPDWMHSGDMGVAQDVAAHIFVDSLETFAGRTKEAQCRQLWLMLRQWYEDTQVPHDHRMQQLQVTDFQRKNQPNKLRGKAAHARALVPFLPYLCRKQMPDTDRGRAATATAEALACCYHYLPQAPCQELASASRKFANQYCALQALVELETGKQDWHVKPKLHLFQELCEYCGRNPRDFWCYADETFGNSCADFAVRRGGRGHPGHNTEVILQRWCCSTPFPTPF